ncbi:hypothetical protein JQN72_09915 [Phycicoccus sp. CSK15P-2]|uniref:hypothetical protein n=1 Tax=Phycicoccus sp. CSK15P-2 TaxID=2807627 RepID=UPI0019528C29|nr:hypothetical protein [Phycicoccus sp. CSK15P-2]MBM6404555.1 hypothetical protein [Phycicoccus sp. CSK15P-2]
MKQRLVPRNDVRNQTMQPEPRQVEWAVDQAVRGVLTTSRPANWNPEDVHGIVAGWNRTPGESGNVALPSQQSFHPKVSGHGDYATSMNATLRQMGL